MLQHGTFPPCSDLKKKHIFKKHLPFICMHELTSKLKKVQRVEYIYFSYEFFCDFAYIVALDFHLLRIQICCSITPDSLIRNAHYFLMHFFKHQPNPYRKKNSNERQACKS